MKIFSIILLFSLVFLFSIHTLTSINQDIGRHLVLGKIILETKSVPKTNFFSYTNPDFPFINHHWFGEILIYLGSLFFGLKGLIILKAIIITLAFALSFFAFYKKEKINLAIIAGLISIFILIERTDLRPEIFSFLFLSWYLFVLFKNLEFGISKNLLLTLPLTQLVWANTHIYFFLGPLIFLLFLVLVKHKFLKSSDRLILRIICLTTFLINLINPNYWRGAVYPLTIFKNYGYPIVENQNPFFLKAWGYPWLTTYALFIGIFFVLLSFLLNYKNFKENIFSFSLFIISVILSLKMIRNYPIFALILVPVSMRNFSQASQVIENKGEVKKEKLFLNPDSVLALFLLILISAVIGNQIYEEANLSQRFGLNLPQGAQKAVDFVKENNLKGPIFNNFDVGSFLIWKLPQERVFIDGRPEAYPKDFIQNVYIPMQEDPEKWKFYSEEYRINYVFWLYSDITPWSQKFIRFIQKDKNWPLIYKDNSVMIFLKNKPENQNLIKAGNQPF